MSFSFKRLDTLNNPFVDIPRAQRTFMAVCILTYAVFVCVVGATSGGNFTDKLILLLSSVGFLIAAAFPIIFAFKDIGFLHPLVLTSTFALLNIVLRQTDVLANGLDYHHGLPGWSSNSLISLVAFVNFIGICAFLAKYAGYYVVGKTSMPLMRFNKKPNSMFMPLLILWFCLGLASLALVVQASGGLRYHLINMHRGHAAKVFTGNTSWLGTAGFIVQSTVVIPVLFAAFRKNGHRSPIFLFLVLAEAVIAYLVAGRRSAILTPVLLSIAIWIFKERKLPLVRIAAVGFLLFLFLSVGSLLRQSQRSFSSKLSLDFLSGYSVSDLAEISLKELTDRSGNSAAIYPIIVKVPEKISYNYFQSYLENAYRFIPRAIWKEKPDGIGITCAEVFYNRYDRGGIPPGAYGEAYWSLGMIGIVVVYFMFGMFLKVVGNEFARTPESIGIVVIYLMTVLRLGPDQISFRVWIFSLVPLLGFLIATNLLSLKGRG